MTTAPHFILDPAAIPQVALESMNQTHREEVDLINRLGGLLRPADQDQPDRDALTQALAQWVNHTREHFQRENQLMREYGFPAYPMHSGEHTRVLALIESLQKDWLEQGDAGPLRQFLFEEWPRWFDQHVNSMDAVTARFVSGQLE